MPSLILQLFDSEMESLVLVLFLSAGGSLKGNTANAQRCFSEEVGPSSEV